jgi:DNA-binding CsgD family transcriptional regulator
MTQLKDSTRADMIRCLVDSIKHTRDYSDEKLITELVQSCYDMFGDGEQTDAILTLTAATNHYENKRKLSQEDASNLIQLYVPLGAAYEEIGMSGMAMNIYSRGIEHARTHNLQQKIAMLYNNIGVLYYNIDDYSQSEDYFMRALQINKKLNSKREIFYNYNNIAQIEQRRGELRAAMQNALTGMNYLDPERDSILYYSTHTNIGDIYRMMGDYSMAISFLRNAESHQMRMGLMQDLTETYLLESKTYDAWKMPDSATYYAGMAAKTAEEIHDTPQLAEALENGANLAIHNSNYAEGARLLSKAYALTDSLHKADNQYKMKDWERIYRIQLANYEQASTVSRWNPEWIFYIMLIILVVAATITAYIYYRKHRQAKALIAELNSANHRITQYQSDNSDSENRCKQLQEDIDMRNRHITALNVKRLQHDAKIENVVDEMQKITVDINFREKSISQRLNRCVKDLISITKVSDNEEFNYYFEQVHPSFYARLSELYPSLTTKERRLCAYLALGLSTTDIAQISHREIRSIESSRNRLRKKLNISQEISISDFLARLANPDSDKAS